ncbi:uncharacterized protein LOC127355047 isoform X1 [Dicentrarchus labrax]|uniref:uncharacterized protein LOC127355047 isoform X1 n=1 Tax=Dicentrarchus labrax TaxID=13489 RepID=UPI0021F52E0C|nr:uncharacterized protein LOC127355047 isoform X1 [Dicentrarchus labrax]
MQMAGLCWMAVALVLSLSAGNSWAVVDQNKLARIVIDIVSKYRPHYEVNGKRRSPMFSLALSVPYNKRSKKYDISQVFNTDSEDAVKTDIQKCKVYAGRRVVAATVLKWPDVVKWCPDEPVQWQDVLMKCNQESMTWAELKKMRQDSKTEKECRESVWNRRADHAEYRTLQHFNNLVNNHNENDLLLFYVLASPCHDKCAAEGVSGNILESIQEIKKWNNYALVFTDVFQPPGESVLEENRKALERLGQSVGLSNIFRCNINTPECTSCSVENQVARYCFADEPGPSNNLPSTSQSNNINPSTGVSTNVDSNTGGGQGGSGSGGGKGHRRRRKGKKGKNINQGVRNTDVDSSTGGQADLSRHKARKVGGRRVGRKQGGGGNKQKSKKKTQTNKRKKAQSRGTTQWSQGVEERTKKQSQKRQKSKQPKRRENRPRGAEMRRINQPRKTRKDSRVSRRRGYEE